MVFKLRPRFVLPIIFTFLLITAGALVWRPYADWKLKKDFPNMKSFYVKGLKTGNPPGPFIVENDGTILVMLNPGFPLHLSISCSKKGTDNVRISFHAGEKTIGTENFKEADWRKSFVFDGKLLGRAGFLTMKFHIEGAGKKEVEIRECVFRAKRENPKVLILGLDGLSWKILDPLIKQNKCPNFKRLLQEGVSAVFHSEEPTYSPVIWTTIATGRPPSDHGVTFYLASGGHPVIDKDVRVKRFWNIFSEFSDLNLFILGWYLTWPVEDLQGVMISDRSVYFNEEKQLFYPEAVFDKEYFDNFRKINSTLNHHLVGFTSFHYYPDYRKRPKLSPAEKKICEIISKRLAHVYRRDYTFAVAGLKFFKSLRPDIFSVYLRGADFTQHGFWKYMDPESVPFYRVTAQEQQWLGGIIEKYYIYLDEVVGEYWKAAGKDSTMFIISDHGFGPILKPDLENPDLSGDHRVEGVFLAVGPAFRRGESIPSASIYDFLPTLLYVSGLPAAEDMPGKILTDAIQPDYLHNHPVRRIESFGARKIDDEQSRSTKGMDEEIKDELRSLGYIQ
jgi:hypothetical protein